MPKNNYWVEFKYTSKDIGEMIKMLRTERLNLTTAKMAEDIGLEESLLIQYEEGNMKTNFVILKKIADIYKLDVTIKFSSKPQ